MEEIFVTGATGFIGARLVQALLARGSRVRALSRRADPPPLRGLGPEGENLWRHERVELVRGDITDRDSLQRGMEGCRHVFHLAAYAKNWAPDPQTFVTMNVEGVRNVFDVAARRGVERVVWTSSIATFGPTARGTIGDEDTPRLTPHYFTDYEATKVTAEQEALARAREGFPVVIVNPTRVFGPGHLTEANALTLLIDQYDRGKVPVLPNRGVNVGNYVLVDDVVEGHLLAMEKGRVGERYILGGENATLKQLFRLIDQVSGKRHFQIPMLGITPLVYSYLLRKRAEWFGVYPRITPGWVRTYLTDWAHRCDKAQRELGYRPTPLVEGLRITYEWLQRTRKGGR
jgi:nucleoside-diphosphate-sugar epimerase